MKKIKFLATLFFIFLLTSCNKEKKRSFTFFDSFDTEISIIMYTKTNDEFEKYVKIFKDEFTNYGKLYDIYKDYDGVTNLKTINEKAYKEPLEVDEKILDMLSESIELSYKYGKKVNIAVGSLTNVWHNYREEGLKSKSDAKLPPMEELTEAKKHINLEDIIIDKTKKTIFIKDPELKIDVGAFAKGYATDKVAEKLKGEGLNSFIISAGGNIKAVGKPLDERKFYSIGIQNPFLEKEEKVKDIIYKNDVSVVTSGDYQRFYSVNGKNYHHIIDIDTLMPEGKFKSVTVVTDTGFIGDYLSTLFFLSSKEEAEEIADKIGNVGIIWIDFNGEMTFTENIKGILKSQGAKES